MYCIEFREILNLVLLWLIRLYCILPFVRQRFSIFFFYYFCCIASTLFYLLNRITLNILDIFNKFMCINLCAFSSVESVNISFCNFFVISISSYLSLKYAKLNIRNTYCNTLPRFKILCIELNTGCCYASLYNFLCVYLSAYATKLNISSI